MSDETPNDEFDEDVIEWTVNLQSAPFSTAIRTTTDKRGSDVEEMAKHALIKAIEHGEVPLRWSLTPKTAEDRRRDAEMTEAMTLTCEECGEEDPMGNTITEYETDEGDVLLVCPGCRADLRAED